jgi:hypothetical protein
MKFWPANHMGTCGATSCTIYLYLAVSPAMKCRPCVVRMCFTWTLHHACVLCTCAVCSIDDYLKSTDLARSRSSPSDWIDHAVNNIVTIFNYSYAGLHINSRSLTLSLYIVYSWRVILSLFIDTLSTCLKQQKKIQVSCNIIKNTIGWFLVKEKYYWMANRFGW